MMIRVSADDLALLTAGCADRNNMRAQELVNVLGCSSATDIVAAIHALPPDLQRDLEKHLRDAIDEQKRRVRPR